MSILRYVKTKMVICYLKEAEVEQFKATTTFLNLIFYEK